MYQPESRRRHHTDSHYLHEPGTPFLTTPTPTPLSYVEGLVLGTGLLPPTGKQVVRERCRERDHTDLAATRTLAFGLRRDEPAVLADLVQRRRLHTAAHTRASACSDPGLNPRSTYVICDL